MEMRGQFHAPAALPSGTQWRTRVGFNAVQKGNTYGFTTNTVPNTYVIQPLAWLLQPTQPFRQRYNTKDQG